MRKAFDEAEGAWGNTQYSIKQQSTKHNQVFTTTVEKCISRNFRNNETPKGWHYYRSRTFENSQPRRGVIVPPNILLHG
ncbi:MAG TPA: hypothetical protein VF141_11850, partial [Chryseolinea sp.]